MIKNTFAMRSFIFLKSVYPSKAHLGRLGLELVDAACIVLFQGRESIFIESSLLHKLVWNCLHKLCSRRAPIRIHLPLEQVLLRMELHSIYRVVSALQHCDLHVAVRGRGRCDHIPERCQILIACEVVRCNSIFVIVVRDTNSFSESAAHFIRNAIENVTLRVCELDCLNDCGATSNRRDCLWIKSRSKIGEQLESKTSPPNRESVSFLILLDGVI